MPVRHALLALLGETPAHGYQLKAAFEARTGGSWQLNIGQVYSTLQRLERDGLVVAEGANADRIVHHLTDQGRAALRAWFSTPIVPVPPPRDELAIKVLMAIGSPDVDEQTVMQHQRRAILEHLQGLTRRKAQLDPDTDLAELLHLDALLLRSEAEIRWLDTCEARLRQRRASTPEAGTPGVGGHQPASRPRGSPQTGGTDEVIASDVATTDHTTAPDRSAAEGGPA